VRKEKKSEKMFKSILIILFLMCSRLLIPGQGNLVLNPSFEEYYQCPDQPNQTNYAKFWTNPAASSSDYFNACATYDIDIPVNTNYSGFQYPRTGNAYMGMVMNGPNLPDETVREYIQGQLSCPLVKGYKYHVEFYTNLLNASPVATSTMGVYFTSYLMDTVSLNLFGCIPQIQNNPSNIISDTLNWVKVSGEFIAAGGEQYFIIGNFYPDSSSVIDTIYPENIIPFDDVGYYYVDDVSVILIDSITYEFSAPNVFTPNHDGINDAFIIHTDSVVDMQLTIYNRWGGIVQQIDGLNHSWDGYTLSGSEAIEGIYFYVAILTLPGCNTEIKNGFVHLFR